MSIGLEGQNLIFLISQPRAGSTLTQQILGSHPDIHTVSEPWILLSSLYPLNSDNFKAEYNAKLAKIGWQTFFQQLPDNEEVYYQGLRSMYCHVFNCALKTTEKKLFLDKTPRYYYIIPELYRTFPKAQFIILLRNPLAVLCSIINTWADREWSKIDDLKYDIIKAPSLLLEGIKKLADRCLLLQYEKIITNPENELQKVCHAMDIAFYPSMIKYGTNNPMKTRWRFGDQNLVYQKNRPDPHNLDKWILSLQNHQIWQAANDYLEFLGHETVYRMGYSYRELRKTLDENCPKDIDSTKIVRVEWLKREPSKCKATPQTSSGYVVTAKQEEREGQLLEAATAYRQAIELNPNSAWSHHSLGTVLARLQKWDEAIAAYQKAIELNSNSASFHYKLAEALTQQGKANEGIVHYQKAVKLQPKSKLFRIKLKSMISQNPQNSR